MLLSPFLACQFPPGSFSGRSQIVCRGPNSSILVPSLTCDYDALSSRLATFSLSSRCDYYITSNLFSGVSRSLNQLFALTNLVLDIDCHSFCDSADTFSSFLDNFLFRLKHSCWDTLLPPPTSIVKTGRGLQFWWSIQAISAKFKPFYDELLSYYSKILDSFCVSGTFEDFSALQLDWVASKNAAGVFRLPYTWNSKSGTFVTVEVLGTTYALMDLFSDMKENFHEEFSPSAIHSTSQFPTISEEAWIVQAERRVEVFYQLRELRSHQIGLEERNNFCFMVYNALVPCYGHQKAYHAMISFNQGFSQPLHSRELDSVISSAKKKGGYQYSSSKIQEFLHISSEEALLIGFTVASPGYLSKKSQKKAQTLVKKKDRDGEILRLYGEGRTMSQVAHDLTLSIPTVSKVLQAHDSKRPDQRRQQAHQFLKDGKSLQEMANIWDCSVKTVRRVLLKEGLSPGS